MKASKALVVFSGGQDSTTCLYWAQKEFSQIEALTFDYEQRHKVELDCAKRLCEMEKIPHHFMKLGSLTLFGANSLTDSKAEIKPDSALLDNSLPNTFVPGRNLVFLSLAASFAVSRGIWNLVMGICEADSSGYPDCRKAFRESIENSIQLALGTTDFKIHTPLLQKSKAEIFQLAYDLEKLENVLEYSHTCYEGVRADSRNFSWGHGCGNCPACVLRKKGYEKWKEGRLQDAH
jgi:7-cyano-7-deazaguanine synthase